MKKLDFVDVALVCSLVAYLVIAIYPSLGVEMIHRLGTPFPPMCERCR